MKSLTLQRLERPGLTFLKLSGVIDETFSVEEVAGQVHGEAILHLGRVTRLSSFGVREWVRLMHTLRGRLKHYLLVECSPAVVNQLNVVGDFAAGAYVKSIQLPYACDACGIDKTRTVDLDAERAALLAGRVPAMPCPQCGKAMTFDDLPDVYFSFLKDAPSPPAGSPLATFVSQFERAAPSLEEPAEVVPAAVSATLLPSAPPPPAAPLPVPVPVPPLESARTATASPPGRPLPGWAIPAGGAALIALVLGVWRLVPERPAAPQPPVPPAASPQRQLSADELLEINGLVARERFAEADAVIAGLSPHLTAESLGKLRELVRAEKQTAGNRHLTAAQNLSAENRSKEAIEELRKATELLGPSEDGAALAVALNRRDGNCQAVLSGADEFARQYPHSLQASRVLAQRRACLPSPAKPPHGRVAAAPNEPASTAPPADHPKPLPPVSSITPAIVRGVADAHKAEVEGCIARNKPGGTGAIAFSALFTADGRAKGIRCDTPSLAGSALHHCLADEMVRWDFPPHPGRPQQVAFSFRY